MSDECQTEKKTHIQLAALTFAIGLVAIISGLIGYISLNGSLIIAISMLVFSIGALLTPFSQKCVRLLKKDKHQAV